MSSWNCLIDGNDTLTVNERVEFTVMDNLRPTTAVLSYRDAMQVAAEIVRIAHGARTPRVWETADSVPDGVTVAFDDGVVARSWAVRYGDAWIYRDGPEGEWEPWEHDAHSPDDYSPFTEVI